MKALFNGIKAELKMVEKELIKAVQAPDPIITNTSIDLIMAGGKRLRPAFCLLGAKFHNFDLEKVLPLAVALELAHMATLVHDDVVDAALTRRGLPTIKAKWGNKISVHVGDYLLGKSMILISSYNNDLIHRVICDTSVKMCEGEIQQISAAFDTEQTIKDYFYRIKRKTALLIAASCQFGAVACNSPPEIHQALRRYGNNIGMAFQITDDILDMTAEQKRLGKPVGGDLRQGIITLPVIYALKNSQQQKRILELVHKPEKTDDEIQETISIIKDCGALDYSNKIAQKYISKAKAELSIFPDTMAKQALTGIADFISIRKF